MLSELIKADIERVYGNTIRYPVDCEALSEHIFLCCRQRVSSSTLKRLFGFIRGTRDARMMTLDVIANYLGHNSWEIYLSSLNNTGNSAFVSTNQVNINALEKGDKIELSYIPDRQLTLEYAGDNTFVVVRSKNSKLFVGDTIKLFSLVEEYPLMIKEVKRGNENLGSFIAGKVSGISSIKLIRQKDG